MVGMVCATVTGAMKKHTLESKMKASLLEGGIEQGATFDVIAHELLNDGDGWSTNTSWFLVRGADLSGVLEAARGRWEVFKVNYHPRARVSDIIDAGFDERYLFEVDHIPFLDVRPSGQ